MKELVVTIVNKFFGWINQIFFWTETIEKRKISNQSEISWIISRFSHKFNVWTWIAVYWKKTITYGKLKTHNDNNFRHQSYCHSLIITYPFYILTWTLISFTFIFLDKLTVSWFILLSNTAFFQIVTTDNLKKLHV